MNLAQLLERFRVRSGDRGTPPLWSDEEVTASLNEAEQQACVRARLLRDAETEEVCKIELLPDVRAYRVHGSVWDVISVVAVSPTEHKRVLVRASHDEMLAFITARSNARGLPVSYTFLEDANAAIGGGGLLTLDYAPDAVGYTLELEVHRLPLYGMEQADDEPEIPARHHDALVDWALRCAYLTRDMEGDAPQRAERHEAAFAARFGLLPSADVQRKQQRRRAPTVRMARW